MNKRWIFLYALVLFVTPSLIKSAEASKGNEDISCSQHSCISSIVAALTDLEKLSLSDNSVVNPLQKQSKKSEYLKSCRIVRNAQEQHDKRLKFFNQKRRGLSPKQGSCLDLAEQESDSELVEQKSDRDIWQDMKLVKNIYNNRPTGFYSVCKTDGHMRVLLQFRLTPHHELTGREEDFRCFIINLDPNHRIDEKKRCALKRYLIDYVKRKLKKKG